jgi:hypothetical protein
MSSKSLLTLSLLSLGLVIAQAPLRAQDASPAQPPAPPSDAPEVPATPPTTDGQTPPPPAHHRREGLTLAFLTEKLGLTPEEQKVIGPIIQSGRQQAKELREDDSLSQDDKRAKMKEIAEATRSQIRAALTPAQQTVFDALPQHGGGKPPAPPSATEPTPTPPPTT